MIFLCEIINNKNSAQELRILECRSLDTLAVVPSEIAGFPVTELGRYVFSAHEDFGAGEWGEIFWWDEDGGRLENAPADIPVLKGDRLKELRLPATIRKVGAYAFYNCESIKKMELYSTTLDWGTGVFVGCLGIEELVIHVDEEKKSCLKEVLAELRQTLFVDYLGKMRARLVFSEFFEEAVENTPARILSTNMHGCGQNYRNAFLKTQFQFREYDSLFPQLVLLEPERLAARLALGRLRFPYQLAESYRQAYEQYLAEHCVAAVSQTVERKDMDELVWLMEHVKMDGSQMEQVIEVAGRVDNSEAVSFLMDQKRKTGAVKRRRFQL